MPFIKRNVQPVKVRCHRGNVDDVFEEHEDVSVLFHLYKPGTLCQYNHNPLLHT